MSILLWIVAALLWSVASVLWKKAVLMSKLPRSLFAIFWTIIPIIIVYIIIIHSWLIIEMLWDYKTIWLVLLISLLSFISINLYISVYEKVKLSELLPYVNLDKVFIVLFWFIIFYWTKNSTSITTFLITLSTIFIIIMFSVNFKKINISKDIWLYIFIKFLDAITILIVWYVLLSYTSIQYLAIATVLLFTITIIVSLFLRYNLKLLFTQKKEFYKYRLWAAVIWSTWFIIWLYIIETSWVLIATLISFVWLVFQIFSMKFILNDTPEKKQIILAVIVMIMIWAWYYFR